MRVRGGDAVAVPGSAKGHDWAAPIVRPLCAHSSPIGRFFGAHYALIIHLLPAH